MKTLYVVLLLALSLVKVSAQEKTEESQLATDQVDVHQSADQFESFLMQPESFDSGYISGRNSPSCLNLLRNSYHTNDPQEFISENVHDQMKGPTWLGIGGSAGMGLLAGFSSGNPVIGAGVGVGALIFSGIGNAITSKKLTNTGNVISGSDKILAGYAPNKDEAKAIKKLKKKAKLKNASDYEIAQIVRQQGGLGERLFCDVDRKGRVNLKPLDKDMGKRVNLAKKCNDSKKYRRRVIYTNTETKDA